MTARARVCAALLTATAMAGLLPAQEVPQGFAVESRVDRPAMWVADRVTYFVEIACPKGFDILTDDLDRQKLKTTGLDVVASDSSRSEEGGGVRYRFRYELTTYHVDMPALSIAPFPVRYYASSGGQRPDQLSPAGLLQVPGASIAFRSLLPDDQAASPVRDDRQVPPRRVRYRVLGLAGLALVAVSLVPGILSLAALVRRASTERVRTQLTARQNRRTARAALDELRGCDVSGDDARRDAFARLDIAVRQHLAEACGIPAAGMTVDELARAVKSSSGAPPPDPGAAVFEACELARYAAPQERPSAVEWRRALDAAEEILAARR